MKTESLKRNFSATSPLPIDRPKKKIAISYELFLLLLLTVFVLTVGLVNPAFFSWGTLFDVLRNQTIYILLAFGLLPIVILGGFDVSFVVISSLATFLARVIMYYVGIEAGIGLFYVMSMLAGSACGLILGWTINRFKLSIFDFSLGVTSLVSGLLTMASAVGIRGSRIAAMRGWNMRWLVTVQSSAGRSGLHVSVLLVIAAAVVIHLFLRYTVWGRAMYAAGSDKSVAIRTGLDIKKIYMTAFAILGAMAAVAGVTSSGLGTGSSPFGAKYMTVYATVIIGGASIHGGKGSVAGTLMGVLLVGLIGQALVYMRIPTAWMDFVLGALFIIFTMYQTLENKVKN
ncbi:MAG: ABC transporter permease [Chloroflexi bacterium]|nr:ABC transporter permease [Chloroflexota bacterium]